MSDVTAVSRRDILIRWESDASQTSSTTTRSPRTSSNGCIRLTDKQTAGEVCPALCSPRWKTPVSMPSGARSSARPRHGTNDLAMGLEGDAELKRRASSDEIPREQADPALLAASTDTQTEIRSPTARRSTTSTYPKRCGSAGERDEKMAPKRNRYCSHSQDI